MPFSIKNGEEALKMINMIAEMEESGDIQITWKFSKHHASFTEGSKVHRFIKQHYPHMFDKYLSTDQTQ